jgi:hypothetical protein
VSLNPTIRAKATAAWWEARRLGWVLSGIVALLLVLPKGDPQSNWTLLRFKLGMVLVAVLVAHLVRSQMLPYIHLGEDLRSGDVGRALGAAIVVAALYLAIILAFSLGL